jgi:DNA repair protein RecN (Recombination protein N)
VIVELRVRDLATIEDVTLPLGSGLNVLTGETGAGKSMLVDALALLLGARADAAAVRSGAARAVIEGAFEGVGPALREELTQAGLEAEEDRLVLRREVTAEGRSRGWVNGSPATMGTMAALGALLVDLHGQHETRTLLQPERQRDVLDAFADAVEQADTVAASASAVARLAREETELAATRDEVRRRADYLRHVVNEIDAARLRAGEDEALAVEARRLSQATALSDLARRIAGAVEGEEGSALGALGAADRALTSLAKADPEVSSWHELLDTAFANLQELGRLASDYAESLQEDPARLAEIERRRDVVFRLRQKHGETVEAILAARSRAAEELDLLDTADLDLRALAARREAAERALAETAAELSRRRREAAGRLGRSATRLLPKLGLPGGRLTVELTPLERITGEGAESVDFVVQFNPGLEPRPLARCASGGELSRVMLALKTVLGRHDQVPTLVFDEVDQGIGGEVAAQVGEMLAEVAVRHQVLVITHQAPIAARADRHLAVTKRARGGVATSDVQVLHGEDRVSELARMLGDAEATTARRHALALLKGTVRTAE